MRTISVMNQKGGVGKTTTTANLGMALARAGSSVLLIDLDPQAHLSLHFGVELDDTQLSVYDLLVSHKPVTEVLHQVHPNVALLPADINLAGAEVELVSVTGREVILREALAPVLGRYDYVLIDCPPSLGVLTVNALVATNEVLIPLQAHFLALQGLSRLLDTVTIVRQRINPSLKVGGIVLCLHESTTRLAGEVVDDLTKFLVSTRGENVPWTDAKLYKTCIRRNIKLAESSSFGQTVFDYAPKSNGAIDYQRLAEEMMGTMATIEAPPTEPVAMKSSGTVANNQATNQTVTETTPIDPPSAAAASVDVVAGSTQAVRVDQSTTPSS